MAARMEGRSVLVTTALWADLVAWVALATWMSIAVWHSARGDRRMGDTARLIVFMFSLLLAYRDLRIIFADDSDKAKIIMAVLGVSLAGFTAMAAKAYGRGARLS